MLVATLIRVSSMVFCSSRERWQHPCILETPLAEAEAAIRITRARGKS